MHNLETLIAQWRKDMLARPSLGRETLDELENHLREHVDQLVRSGMSEPEAFQHAVAQLGGAPTITSEFGKVHGSAWFPIKLVTGLGVVWAAMLLTFAIVQLNAARLDFLLAGHFFFIGLGYSTTFLIGALGICYVGQRCLSDFSASRMHSLTRFTWTLGCLAAGLTVMGLILGMIWAKAEWGRYWAWDIKETGAFAIIVWQLLFLLLHRFTGCSPRRILSMSLLGNIVVTLGWFGSDFLSHSDRALHYSLFLLAGVVCHTAFFLIGLAPVGCLRRTFSAFLRS